MTVQKRRRRQLRQIHQKMYLKIAEEKKKKTSIFRANFLLTFLSNFKRVKCELFFVFRKKSKRWKLASCSLKHVGKCLQASSSFSSFFPSSSSSNEKKLAVSQKMPDDSCLCLCVSLHLLPLLPSFFLLLLLLLHLVLLFPTFFKPPLLPTVISHIPGTDVARKPANNRHPQEVVGRTLLPNGQ